MDHGEELWVGIVEKRGLQKRKLLPRRVTKEDRHDNEKGIQGGGLKILSWTSNTHFGGCKGRTKKRKFLRKRGGKNKKHWVVPYSQEICNLGGPLTKRERLQHGRTRTGSRHEACSGKTTGPSRGGSLRIDNRKERGRWGPHDPGTKSYTILEEIGRTCRQGGTLRKARLRRPLLK